MKFVWGQQGREPKTEAGRRALKWFVIIGAPIVVIVGIVGGIQAGVITL